MHRSAEARSKAFILSAYKRITSTENTTQDFSVGMINDDIYRWMIVIIGPKGTPYEHGIFRAEMVFPKNYPDSPPTFKFITKMWHPNIASNGDVCISILHEPGNDEYGYEDVNERWLPVRSPETVIISIICLLNAPNCGSPANIEAALQCRDTPDLYKKKVKRLAEATLEEDF